MATKNFENNIASISPDTGVGSTPSLSSSDNSTLSSSGTLSLSSSDLIGGSTPSLSSSSPIRGSTPSLSSSDLIGGSIGQSNHYYGFSGRTPDGVCRRMTGESELSSSGTLSLSPSGLTGGSIRQQCRIAECGRSMVEILGVIAIIGVLTLVGIIGFKYAMDKYKANEIVHEVGLRASDIFHRYQTIPLPEPGTGDAYNCTTNDFKEWTPETNVGYVMNTCAIKDKDGADLAFAIAVKDVPMGVCQRLIEIEPHKYMEGFHYMIVNDKRFVRNQPNICSEDMQNVIFVMLLDGEFEECTGDDCAEVCIYDKDCEAVCKCAICDEDTLTCILPFTNEGEPQVCNKGECEKTEKCEMGVGFRTKSGVCVSCTDNSDYALDPDDNIFEIEKEDGTIIKDAATPKELCTGCGGERKWAKNAAGDIRCFIDCPLGFGYTPYKGLTGDQYGEEEDDSDYNKGCIPCGATADFAITSEDTLAEAACKACGHYVYDQPTWSIQSVRICGVPCANGYFKGTLYTSGSGYYGGKCYACNTTDAPIIVPDGTGATGTIDHKQQCTDCDGRIVIRTSGKNFCVNPGICGDKEFITAPYLGNPVFHEVSCQSCNDTTSYMIFRNQGDNVSGWETFVSSCEACGNRKVIQDEQGDWWCVPMDQTCAANDEFLDTKGVCHKCSDAGAYIVSDDYSGCTACKERYVDAESTGHQICLPECGEDYPIQGMNGNCYSCDDDASVYVAGYEKLKAKCTSCENRYLTSDGYCIKKPVCQSGEFLSAKGECTSCSVANYVSVSNNDTCTNCPYESETNQGRTYAPEGSNGPSCHLINPGVSGSCNYLGDFQGYYSYNDSERKLLRDTITGLCVPCDSTDEVNLYDLAYKEQCTHCGDIRVLNGVICSFNPPCSEEGSFWNQELGRCMLCADATENRYETTYVKNGLCSGCGLRFMEVEETTDGETVKTYYCAKKCANGQWQDVLGNCINCADEGTGGNYIGADKFSQTLCTDCGRTVKPASLSGWVCEKES